MPTYSFRLVCRNLDCEHELNLECCRIGSHGCKDLGYLPMKEE